MASVDIEIATRKYTLACREGEETHLRSVAAMVDRKARDAGAALGNLSEARQLLFASLLLADEINELRGGGAPADPGRDAADALERLADRVEALADRLETGAENA
jgi:cell division protein ZapA